MATIADTLAGKTSSEQAQLKAKALCDVAQAVIDLSGSRRALEFAMKDGRQAKVSYVGLGHLDLSTNTVQPRKNTKDRPDALWLRVSVDGKHPNGDGWYGIQNPPIMVPDGTTREVTDDLTGERMKVPNFREDPQAALLIVLASMLGGEV